MGRTKYDKQGMSTADRKRLNGMLTDPMEPLGHGDIVISRPTNEGWINGPWSRKIYLDRSYPANRTNLVEIGEIWTIGGDNPSDRNTHHQVRMFVDKDAKPTERMMTILEPSKRRFIKANSSANAWYWTDDDSYIEVGGWDTVGECKAAVVDYFYSSMATITERQTGRFSGWQ